MERQQVIELVRLIETKGIKQAALVVIETVVKKVNADDSLTSEEIVVCIRNFLEVAALQMDIMLAENLARILAHLMQAQTPAGDAKNSNF